MRVRTGRFPMREHTTVSGIAMGLHPQSADREQPLAFEPGVRHLGLCGQGSRQVPVALAADGGENGLALTCAECEEVAHLGARAAPLLPVGEPRAEHRREDLRDGLLDYPVGNRRAPQHAHPSTFWLACLDPPNGRGSIAAIEQGSADGGPVLLRKGRELVDADPIDARCPPGWRSLASMRDAGSLGPSPAP